MNSSANQTKAAPVMLAVGIALIAANLRAPLTSVGPVIDLIQENLRLSGTRAGMITTLPLFAFALFSPLAPGLARRFGAKTVLFYSLVSLTLGILLRSWLGNLGLFLGTAMLGLSIAAGNVLIPSLIKKELPEHIGIMTGVYTFSMNIFAAIASGISAPLAVGLGLGWTGALRIWAALSLLAAILWLPQRRAERQAAPKSAPPARPAQNLRPRVSHGTPDKQTPGLESAAEPMALWRSPLAWQVTLYMGLQSTVFYCMSAWMPTILTQRGMAADRAGWMLSLLQLTSTATAFSSSILVARKVRQRLLVIVGAAGFLLGLAGLLWGGAALSPLWSILLGTGGGVTFSLAILFFNLRTKTADEAARLSGMAQTFGYLLAAFGPMLFGYLRDATGGWTAPLLLAAGAAAINLLAGLGASRPLYVGSAAGRKEGVPQ